MRIVGLSTLKKYKSRSSQLEDHVNAWIQEVKSANWINPHDMKSRYPQASIIGQRNVVFNICNNRYRLWVKIDYQNQIVMIKKMGTHKEYNQWQIL